MPGRMTEQRSQFGRGLVGAWVGPSHSIDISKQINQKGISLKGIFGRRIWETWEHLAALVEHKKVKLNDVITHTFSLNQYKKAFEQVHGDAGKVLLKP